MIDLSKNDDAGFEAELAAHFATSFGQGPSSAARTMHMATLHAEQRSLTSPISTVGQSGTLAMLTSAAVIAIVALFGFGILNSQQTSIAAGPTLGSPQPTNSAVATANNSQSPTQGQFVATEDVNEQASEGRPSAEPAAASADELTQPLLSSPDLVRPGTSLVSPSTTIGSTTTSISDSDSTSTTVASNEAESAPTSPDIDQPFTTTPETQLGGDPLSTEETWCDGHTPTLVGSNGPDVLVGTPGADIIAGGNGADVIYGLSGDDIICGGNGPDTLHAGPGFDQLFGGNGADVLLGSEGEDILEQDRGQDPLEKDLPNP